ncbi:response regulator [Geomesophilobacter sediminis]|uniref:Response regulator n=1 Tax=Geomesophilobacter sediminis TaxID=2798584 RepID=A0A8J7M2L5_9BACT|nr:response regulator [Geomesophilobacter sediminis]MBJ6727374.1 response regulator [Geomesophilobacter sediminis]
MEAESGVRSGISVLVVDDDAGAREALGRILPVRFPGVAVFLAEDGAEGLASFQKHRHEIVITDLSMSRGDGTWMAAEIRKMSPRVAVIAITAHTSGPCLVEAGNAGISHILKKPLNLKELLGILDKLVAAPRG